MVRMRAPQRFALGTRVAIPVEGRTGSIEAYNVESGVYTLAFSDGFRQQVDASSIDTFVIRSAPSTASNGSGTASLPAPAVVDPNALLGARVVKVTTSYEGKKSVTEGQVASYFPDVQRYRVLLEDGVYVDMEVDEVKRAMAEAAEVMDSEQLQPKKRHRDGKDGKEARKKSKKTADGRDSTSAIAVDEEEQEERRELPLNAKKLESRPAAYTIARKILITILEQHSTQRMRTDKQLSILRNDDIKPKRALEGFVDAGGLRAMQKVLQLWIRTPATHPGALLALKVVALLPGVTMDALMQSNIAQTLRSIERASQTIDLVDMTLGDLARWIIRSWKKNVVKRPVTPSPRDLLLEQAGAIHRAGNSGEIHLLAPRATSTPSPLSTEGGEANLSLRGKKPSAHRVETARLQAMLTGDEDAADADGTTTTTTTASEEVIYLPQYNSLGSEDARREQRPIKLLDTLVARLTENIDGVVPHERSNGDEQDARKKQIDDSIVAPGRMKFAERPQVWMVDHSRPVGELLATARDRLVSAPSSAVGSNSTAEEEEGRLLPRPNKTTAPTKSILKVKALDVTPAAQIRWA